MAERHDTLPKVKVGGLRFQFEVSYMSGHTEELRLNKTVSLWMAIYVYIHFLMLDYNNNYILTSSIAFSTCLLYLVSWFNGISTLFRLFNAEAIRLEEQQCPACLVRLTWIVFVMGSRWPYSWCLVGCCRLDLFNIACNILE